MYDVRKKYIFFVLKGLSVNVRICKGKQMYDETIRSVGWSVGRNRCEMQSTDHKKCKLGYFDIFEFYGLYAKKNEYHQLVNVEWKFRKA